MIVTRRGTIVSNMGSSMYSKNKSQEGAAQGKRGSVFGNSTIAIKMRRKSSLFGGPTTTSAVGRKGSILGQNSKIITQDNPRRTSILLGKDNANKGQRRPSMLNEKESSDARPVSKLTLPRGPNETTTSNNNQSPSRKYSILSLYSMSPSVRQSTALNNSRADSKSQSLAALDETELVDLQVIASVQLSFQNGIPQDEYEFELNDRFHSVLVQIYKKGVLSDTLLSELEIPALCFEPDERNHEEWYTLHNLTDTNEKGHRYKFILLKDVRPCYFCDMLLYDPEPDNQTATLRCDTCGTICHENCNPKILATCNRLAAVRVKYIYIRAPILVSPF
jgi:hypothetical protein